MKIDCVHESAKLSVTEPCPTQVINTEYFI